MIALIENVTVEAGECDHLARLQRVVRAVANACPDATASEALMAAAATKAA